MKFERLFSNREQEYFKYNNIKVKYLLNFKFQNETLNLFLYEDSFFNILKLFYGEWWNRKNLEIKYIHKYKSKYSNSLQCSDKFVFCYVNLIINQNFQVCIILILITINVYIYGNVINLAMPPSPCVWLPSSFFHYHRFPQLFLSVCLCRFLTSYIIQSSCFLFSYFQLF